MKKLFFCFCILFLYCSGNLFAQQQWLNTTPVYGTDSITFPVAVVVDSHNQPWVFSQDDNFSSGVKLFTKVSNVWTFVTSFAIMFPQVTIDNNDIIYICIGSSLITSYNTATGVISDFNLGGGGNLYQKAFVNPVNNDKWFLSSYPTIEWVKVNSIDTIHYSYASLGISGTYIPPKDACFNIQGEFYFICNDSAGYCKILKFDAAQWTVYDMVNYNLTQDNYPDGITCDPQNNIWFSCFSSITQQVTLVKFNGTNIIEYLDSTPMGGNPNSIVKSDNLGNIWCFRPYFGISKFDGTSFTPYYAPFAIEEAKFFMDAQHNLWFYHVLFIDVQQPGLVIFNEGGFKNLSGKVYDDINANGVLDIGENGIANENVLSTLFVNCSKTDVNGNYSILFLDSNQICQINHQLKPYRTHTTTPTTYNITPAINGTTGFDFGVYATPGINDMTVYTPATRARPGFDCSYNINWNNTGTTTQSDTITFTYDPALTYHNATPTPLSVSGNTLKWKFTNAQPLDNGNITVHFNVPVTIAIGDTLNCLAAIGNVSIDNTPADNVWASQTIVRGSFDPNEKIAEPSQFAVAGEWLYYTIYFQNTGTDTAFTVIVRDTLDANLDIASFEMLGSSHPCYTELSGFGFLKFTFNNILLPDSNVNETMSHGYVTYRVRAGANVAIGTPISNTAYIYFDFNSPIITNTTLNTVHNPLGVKEVFVNNDFVLIPNPASNYISINATGIKLPYTVEITDATGRVLNKVNATAKQQRINTSKLVNGVYFVTVRNEQTQFTKKLVVQK